MNERHTTDAVVVQGLLDPAGRLNISGPIQLPPGAVEVTIKRVPEKRDTWDVLEEIWKASRDRGAVPRSAEEIDAEIDALRNESEEEARALERIAEQATEPPPC